jgi:integrase
MATLPALLTTRRNMNKVGGRVAKNKLRDTQIRAASHPGILGDGDGLWLRISLSGNKSWIMIWRRQGRRREMGLGSFGSGTGTVSLAAARVKAEEVRGILGRGGDPFTEMLERKRAIELAIKPTTFGQCAEDYIGSIGTQWRNPKHRGHWRMTIDTYAKAIGKLPVENVATDDIVRCLKPIWLVKTETATRLRGRIEKILDHAKARGLRTGENPARWKGHLDHILPVPQKLQRGHHAALPYADIPHFIKRLKEVGGYSARVLEFAILTAARSGEARQSEWKEFDLAAAVWTVPASRMKAKREHRVPLSYRAVEILEEMKAKSLGDFVFPGARPMRPLSDMSLAAVLKRLGHGDITVHGFRSSFRDWVGEATDFQREVAEAALAHVVGDETERAYARGDVLEKRRALMTAWADFCASAA